METPNNIAGKTTEKIMSRIFPHIKREEAPQENHHYNRTYEIILKVLEEIGL